MSVSPFLRPLGIVAAILGTLQGLTWTVLSLLVILLSSQAWKPELSNFYNFNLIAYALFFLERDSNGSSESDLIFTGTTVLVFGCLYLVISFIWAVSSMTLTWIFMREKYENARISCKSWSVITIITTILDFILIIILAIDLEKYSLKEEDDYTVASMKYVYGTVVGIAMTIAARGFVLLIINPILAIYLLKYSKEVSPSPNPIRDNRPIINAYQDPNSFNWNENPRSPITPISPRSPSNFNNYNYVPDDDPNYHRSVSQLQEPPRRYIPSEPAIPGRQQQKQRAPQAPNQMQRDYRDNNNMRDPRDISPQIPAPDYDNPRRGELERMPRSALKTKSYY
ncbi:uncharacterized protein [Onthophagus taurus]|uniref:uncharacterized protein isoform X1 n=1 Tax=Onthophagus taurus TaxID=166361 RepID=UPI0039BDDBC0